MRKKIRKINIFIFVLIFLTGGLFSSQLVSASECEDTYGGTCSDDTSRSTGEIALNSAKGIFGCQTGEYCYVYKCEGTEIQNNFGNTVCLKKTDCSEEMNYALDCKSIIGSDGVCCKKALVNITSSTAASSSSNAGIVPCGGESDPCTLCHLIIGIWNLIEWGKNILVTVAIVAIFISGIMYTVSTGNEKLITQAKAFLTASLVGFAITLAAWLIVDVAITWVANADPQLGIGKSSWHTFTCDTASSALSGSGTTTGRTITTSTGTGTDAALRKTLTDAGFSIKSSGNCSDRNNSRCTSLDGMENNAISEIIAVKNACGINTITGANETGHSSHNGLTFDVEASSTQAQCVYNNSSQLNVAQLCTDSANSRLRKNCDGYNEPNGILHIRFNN